MTTRSLTPLVVGKTYIIQNDGYNFNSLDIGKPVKFEGLSESGHYQLAISLVEGIKYRSLMFHKLSTDRQTFGEEPVEYNPDPVGFEEGHFYRVVSKSFDFESTHWENRGDADSVIGSVFKVDSIIEGMAFDDDNEVIATQSEFDLCREVLEEDIEEKSPLPASIDSHYDNWYTLTQDEIDLGKVKIDPYLYYGVNSIGDDDKFGCKMHMLKNLSRHKESNSQEREIVGLYKTIKRMAELNGIDLEKV
jgi:hypothetical protein